MVPILPRAPILGALAKPARACENSSMSIQNSDNARSQAAVWTSVDAYFTGALIQEDTALAVARESGARTTMPQAEVASNQGALLSLITQMVGARRVLEFGTLAGYSTIWFARAVGGEGKVVTLELEAQNAAVARENISRAGVADRVEILVGEAASSAQRLIDRRVAPFDVVFIDADKANNPAYLAAALQLTRSGAVILIDNVVRAGGVLDAESIDPSVQGVRTLVKDIAANPELEATAIQTVGGKGWDGFILVRRR